MIVDGLGDISWAKAALERRREMSGGHQSAPSSSSSPLTNSTSSPSSSSSSPSSSYSSSVINSSPPSLSRELAESPVDFSSPSPSYIIAPTSPKFDRNNSRGSRNVESMVGDDSIDIKVSVRSFRTRLVMIALIIFFVAIIARDVYIDLRMSWSGEDIIWNRRLDSHVPTLNLSAVYKMLGVSTLYLYGQTVYRRFNYHNPLVNFMSGKSSVSSSINSDSSSNSYTRGGDNTDDRPPTPHIHGNSEFILKGYLGTQNGTAFVDVVQQLPSLSPTTSSIPMSAAPSLASDHAQPSFRAPLSKMQGLDNKANHFLALDGLSADLCDTKFKLGEYYYQGHIIDENNQFYIPVFLDGAVAHKHIGICLAAHQHHHMLKIQTLHLADSAGDCDIYVKAGGGTYPTPTNWDWRSSASGSDVINIYSFAREFQNARNEQASLLIGVYGKNNWNKCSLGVEIVTLPKDEIIYKLGLRGGQLLVEPE